MRSINSFTRQNPAFALFLYLLIGGVLGNIGSSYFKVRSPFAATQPTTITTNL